MISRRSSGGPPFGRHPSMGRSGIGRTSSGRLSEEPDEEPGVERRLPRTPIYEAGGPFPGSMERGLPPKMLRDQLYDRMCDWRGHTIAEMEKWLPGNKWVEAMIDLIAFGFAFDREVLPDGTKTLCLRKRELHEHRQQVVDILSGVTLPDRITMTADPTVVLPEPKKARRGQSVVPQESSVLVDEGQWTPPPETESMVLDVNGDIVLSVPDLVTDTIGILARKGAGKTYLAMVIAEEFLASTFDIPFVVLDPTGVWWGLLSDAEGKPTTSRLAVFGGSHGHYPLSSRDGAIMAKTVVACRPLPFIFDLSSFPREEQHRFCADFSAELYLANKEPLHIFIDEADGFAPQRLDGKSSMHQKRSLVEIDCLVRRGRVHGLGVTLITQRPAVISKNVISQVGAMFFLETGAPHDLRAIDDWLIDRIGDDVRRQCREELPVLGKGQTFYMRGGEHYRFCKFTVRPKRTVDSSYTPRIGEKPLKAETYQLTAEDRAMLDEAMEAVRSGVFVSGEGGVVAAGALKVVHDLAESATALAVEDGGDEVPASVVDGTAEEGTEPVSDDEQVAEDDTDMGGDDDSDDDSDGGDIEDEPLQDVRGLPFDPSDDPIGDE